MPQKRPKRRDHMLGSAGTMIVNVTLNESGEICGSQFRKSSGTAAESLPKEMIYDGQVSVQNRCRQPSLLR